MALEIERKFLIDKAKWDVLEKPNGQLYRQGYLSSNPNMIIRIRNTETTGYLTIKGKLEGATRPEFEYEIPKDEAIQLLQLFAPSSVVKKRYKIVDHGKIWEVDEFLEDNLGLFIAEIELHSEDEQIEIPEWIEKEVTDDKRYYNSYLSTNPFTNW